MKEDVSESEFIHRFETMNRGNNFTYKGRAKLYEYLTQLEEDTGKEMELDVIAVCCEYNEYEDIKEFLNDYSNTIKVKRTDFDTDDEYKEAVLEEIQEHTTLIMIDDGSFIIQAF